MEIMVYNIDRNVVYFTSNYGRAHGIWKDEEEPVFGVYSVEVDVVDKIYYNDIKVTSNQEAMISNVGDKIIISAFMNDYFDGCATLQLGNNIIEIITEKNEQFKTLCGKNITFCVTAIEIYDEHIL